MERKKILVMICEIMNALLIQGFKEDGLPSNEVERGPYQF